MKKLFLALVVIILSTTPAAADVIDFEFTVDITSGALLGDVFAGNFTYDETEVVGVDEEFVGLLSFEFDFLGTNYGLGDAIAEAAFFNGEFLGLSYIVDFPAPVSFSFVPGFFSVDEAFFAYEDPIGDGEGSIAYTQVPEPSTLLLLVIGLAVLLSRVSGTAPRTPRRRPVPLLGLSLSLRTLPRAAMSVTSGAAR